MNRGDSEWRLVQGRNDARLRTRLKTLAERYPKCGCPTLRDMLVIEGDVVNDVSRKYVFKIVDFSIFGHRAARELKRIARTPPKTIVCDNGSEFTSKAMYSWAKKARVKLQLHPARKTDAER